MDWLSPLTRTGRSRETVCHMFGAYDPERDELVGMFSSKKNWHTFLDLLKWLRQRYRNGEVLHVILDNAIREISAYAQ